MDRARRSKFPSRRVTADWGHVLFLLGVAAFCLWYVQDAWRASPSVENLIFVVPVAVITLALIAYVMATEIHFGVVPEVEAEPRSPALRLLTRESSLVIAFAAYILLIPFLRFEIANATFFAITFALYGERRPLVLISLALVFGVGFALLFKAILVTPPPTWL